MSWRQWSFLPFPLPHSHPPSFSVWEIVEKIWLGLLAYLRSQSCTMRKDFCGLYPWFQSFRRPWWGPWEKKWISLICMEKEMATHSSVLAWKIPWMEEPGSPLDHQESDTTEWLSLICNSQCVDTHAFRSLQTILCELFSLACVASDIWDRKSVV